MKKQIKSLREEIRASKFSKIAVIYCILYISLFVPFVLVVNFTGHEVSDLLIKYTFYFFGIEVLILGGIKIADLLADVVKLIKTVK